jgi:uncharacterized protein (DUF488 family)
VGIGYEGHDVEGLVERLHSLGVGAVVDVRLTPISRKKGLSKTALGTALADAGIDYLHRRALGNPKHNRPGFAVGGRKRAEAIATFRSLLDEPDATEALTEVRELARERLIALLCFEANEACCHRQVILEALAGSH